jgi:hypothetical protein
MRRLINLAERAKFQQRTEHARRISVQHHDPANDLIDGLPFVLGNLAEKLVLAIQESMCLDISCKMTTILRASFVALMIRSSS